MSKMMAMYMCCIMICTTNLLCADKLYGPPNFGWAGIAFVALVMCFVAGTQEQP